MKMSKFRIAILVLLAVTAIYAITLYQSVQAYNKWKEDKLSKLPEPARKYIDFTPFFASSFGKPYLLLGIGLALCWIFAVPLGFSDDRDKLATFFLIATIWGAFLLVMPASAIDDVVRVDA